MLGRTSRIYANYLYQKRSRYNPILPVSNEMKKLACTSFCNEKLAGGSVGSDPETFCQVGTTRSSPARPVWASDYSLWHERKTRTWTYEKKWSLECECFVTMDVYWLGDPVGMMKCILFTPLMYTTIKNKWEILYIVYVFTSWRNKII